MPVFEPETKLRIWDIYIYIKKRYNVKIFFWKTANCMLGVFNGVVTKVTKTKAFKGINAK